MGQTQSRLMVIDKSRSPQAEKSAEESAALSQQTGFSPYQGSQELLQAYSIESWTFGAQPCSRQVRQLAERRFVGHDPGQSCHTSLQNMS